MQIRPGVSFLDRAYPRAGSDRRSGMDRHHRIRNSRCLYHVEVSAQHQSRTDEAETDRKPLL